MKKIDSHNALTQTEKILFLLIILLSFSDLVHAQLTPPPGMGGDVNAPIDGGLSLLIAGGVGYGIKKIWKRNAHREEGESGDPSR